MSQNLPSAAVVIGALRVKSMTFLYNFLLGNTLLYKYQTGFLPHHSTVFHLNDIFHKIRQAFDNNMRHCIDRVWH